MTIFGMSRRPGVPHRIDERAGNVADAPALDQRDCLVLSLGIDKIAPSSAVRDRLLRRVLQAVGHDPEPESGESPATR